jgi:UDP-N-acetylmuramoyl-tripeptide--D-alanyl-D-alanine ligase
MNKIIKKIIFWLSSAKIVVVSGNYRQTASEAIFQVLKNSGKTVKRIAFPFGCNVLRGVFSREILMIEVDNQGIAKLKKILPRQKVKLLVVTPVGEIPYEAVVFSGKRTETKEIIKFAKWLLAGSRLLLNYDDEAVREIDDFTNLKNLTFGVGQGAKLQATDVIIDNEGTNFKLNFEGKVLPVWLNNLFGKEQVYAALSAIGTALFFEIGLLDACENLKFYKSIPGKMRLIKGVKETWVLDDSENTSPASMMEALEILRQLNFPGRKVAVLGDILGIGKYTVESHESIGEKVAQVVDVLFTIGPRAKFIAQGAEKFGFSQEKIFSYETVDEAKLAVQDEIKEGDVILVDGAKELNMEKIVEEIVKI